MNILVVTSPRTAGTYFIEKFLPEQMLGGIGKVDYAEPASKLQSSDGTKTFYNHNEMFDYRQRIVNNKTTTDPIKHTEQCCTYWQELYNNSNDIHAVKLFRNHFAGKGRMQLAMNVKRIVDSSHKIYVLYRKDITAVVYSLYYAWVTKNYHLRDQKHNKVINVNIDDWRRFERSILLNYEFMLNFAKKHDAEIICTEQDLPHEPYSTYHQFSDTSFVCDKSDYYHEEFQKLKL